MKKEEPDTELETTPVKEESKSDDEELMSTSQISAEFSAMEQHPETPK